MLTKNNDSLRKQGLSIIIPYKRILLINDTIIPVSSELHAGENSL